MATDEAVYEFGPFRMDVRERRLLRDGEPVPLTTKVFETLRVLLERSGRLLTKDELMEICGGSEEIEILRLERSVPVCSGELIVGVGPCLPVERRSATGESPIWSHAVSFRSLRPPAKT
jgi:hypothetical protein